MRKINWTELWEKYRYISLVLLAGILLMLLPTTRSSRAAEKETASCQDTFSLEQTEKRMEELLTKIEGAGRVKLMLTLKSSSQLQLAEDLDRETQDGQQRLQQETVVLSQGSGTESIVVTRQIYPIYQGAVIACQGAGNSAVCLALTQAVSALTGLSSDHISIVKWSS